MLTRVMESFPLWFTLLFSLAGLTVMLVEIDFLLSGKHTYKKGEVTRKIDYT